AGLSFDLWTGCCTSVATAAARHVSCGHGLPGEGDELLEPLRGGARVDRLARELQPLPEVLGMAACGDRARRVEEDRVAAAAAGAGEDLTDARGIRGRVAAAQLVRVAAGDAEVERVDLAAVRLAVDDLVHEVRPGGRELVDSARAVDDERAARAERRQ